MLWSTLTDLFCLEKKTVKTAYIVGGIVLVAFIIAMSILIFLCQRYGKNGSLSIYQITIENAHDYVRRLEVLAINFGFAWAD